MGQVEASFEILLQINFDGAVFKEENPIGIGIVIRVERGQVMASMAKKIFLQSSIVVVEAMVAVKALTFAQDIGLFFLILEGDSEIIINALKSEDVSLVSYGHLIDESKYLAESFTVVHIFHIRRWGNSDAHKIARHVSGFSACIEDISF